MKVFTRNIVIIFLYLAGAVIIAHSVFPHDHHPDLPVYSNDNSCRGTTENSNHHFPFHCHSLNDLVCEKFSASLVVMPGSISLTGIPATIENSEYTVFLTSCRLKFPEIRIPVNQVNLPGNDLLRAPPIII